MKLLAEIRRHGLRQFEVARKAGISESNLSRLINGRYIPNETARRLEKKVARALGRSVKKIFLDATTRNSLDVVRQEGKI